MISIKGNGWCAFIMKAYHRKTLPVKVGREPSAVSETTTILRIMFKVMHVMLHV